MKLFMSSSFAVFVLFGSQTAEAQDAGNSNFEAMPPEDWDRAASVVADLAQDWGTTWAAEEGHEITFGVVEDADEPGIFYFATRRDVDGVRQVSIFRYTASTYGFERLLRVDNAGDAAWYVVGHDSNMVVYAQTNAAYDPGVCGEPLVYGADGTDGAALYQLPDNFAESWDVGPALYTADAADVQTVRDRQTSCEGAEPAP